MTASSHTALEFRFSVDTADGELQGYFADVFGALPPAATADSRYRVDRGADDRWSVSRDGETLIEGTRSVAVSILLWDINNQVTERSKDRYVLLHAAAAHRDGVTVVLPAPMEHGKTTTVAGLIGAGFDYFTDEAVAVDPATLMLTPWPKQLNVDAGSWSTLGQLRPPHAGIVSGQWQVSPLRIRPGCVAAPSEPTIIVSPAFQAGEVTRLERLTPATAVLLLAQSTFSFVDDPDRNLPVLAELGRRCPAYRLVIGELAGAVRCIEGLVADRAAIPT